jgi:hypothetical protein
MSMTDTIDNLISEMIRSKRTGTWPYLKPYITIDTKQIYLYKCSSFYDIAIK